MKNFYKGFTVLLQLEPEPNWKSRSRPKKGSFPPHTRDAKYNPRLWDRDARMKHNPRLWDRDARMKHVMSDAIVGLLHRRPFWIMRLDAILDLGAHVMQYRLSTWQVMLVLPLVLCEHRSVSSWLCLSVTRVSFPGEVRRKN